MQATMDFKTEVKRADAPLVLNKDSARKEAREWIEFICTRKGWTGSELAKRSCLVPSTILRLKNKDDHAYLPSYRTIRAISLGSGFKIPESLMHAFGCDNTGMRSSFETTADRVYSDVRPAPKAETIPVKYLSCLPIEIQFPMPDVSSVECPASLRGKKAFAFKLDDRALEPLIPHGSLLYAVEGRPAPGDLAVITRLDGRSLVRLVDEVEDEGVTILNPKGVKTWIGSETIRSMGIVAIHERV